MSIKSNLLLALALVALAAPGVLIAQDAKLVDAATKEGGKVVVYGSIENDTMDLISAAFKKKTGLDVDFWRSASTKVMDRVLGESRSGKPLYDVALTITPPMEFMFKEGALGKYDSPAAKAGLAAEPVARVGVVELGAADLGGQSRCIGQQARDQYAPECRGHRCPPF